MRCEAKHLCSHARVFFISLFLSFFLDTELCVAVISGTVYQKILVKTRDESMGPEFVPFAFRFLIGPSVPLGEARQKGDFYS
jgi:hypothetical protein